MPSEVHMTSESTMQYSAQDIALIITTVTTAVAALSSIVVPIFTTSKRARSEANQAIHAMFNRLFEQLLRAQNARTENMKNNNLNIQRSAIARKAGTVFKWEFATDDFDLAALQFQFSAKSHGIDVADLTFALRQKTTAFSDYWNKVVNDPEGARVALRECRERDSELEAVILRLGEEFWGEVRSKFPS